MKKEKNYGIIQFFGLDLTQNMLNFALDLIQNKSDFALDLIQNKSDFGLDLKQNQFTNNYISEYYVQKRNNKKTGSLEEFRK